MGTLSDQIIDLLVPIIGRNMAVGSVNTQLKKMGITKDELSPQNVGEFAEYLSSGLKVFAGKDRSDLIVNQIKNMR